MDASWRWKVPFAKDDMAKILLVEDEKDLRFSLVHNLEFEEHQVVEAGDGPRGWELFSRDDYELVILDIMLPGMDGLSLLKKIRAMNQNVPVMMLTAKSTEMDKVIGFELGADDYLTKPFGLGEFLARVKALLRRNLAPVNAATTVKFLDIEMDLANYIVKKQGRETHFSQKEFQLLKYLVLRPRQAIEKRQILDAVWGYTSNATTRTIDTHIARIRRKLDDQNENRIIQTIPTIGYKFVAQLKNATS